MLSHLGLELVARQFNAHDSCRFLKPSNRCDRMHDDPRRNCDDIQKVMTWKALCYALRCSSCSEPGSIWRRAPVNGLDGNSRRLTRSSREQLEKRKSSTEYHHHRGDRSRRNRTLDSLRYPAGAIDPVDNRGCRSWNRTAHPQLSREQPSNKLFTFP
jgi:hypothetical protein